MKRALWFLSVSILAGIALIGMYGHYMREGIGVVIYDIVLILACVGAFTLHEEKQPKGKQNEPS